MRILLVKTSSLGDVIHNLPVVTDLLRCRPGIRIDWCVEESFADIPRLHPGVSEVIPVALRRWRKQWHCRATWREISASRHALRKTKYDAVLDTQGLIKSALIASQADGLHLGYDAAVAREPFAARFYDKTFIIPPNAHAVERNRWLAAAAFNMPVDAPLDYGIAAPPDSGLDWLRPTPYAVLLTATSRDDKLWTEAYWVELATALARQSLTPIFPAGSAFERERAERIAAAIPAAIVAPPLSLKELAGLLGGSALAIGVDTGLAHLAAALKTPTIALYTATDPARTGVYGSGFVRNLGGIGQSPTPADVLCVAEQALRS